MVERLILKKSRTGGGEVEWLTPKDMGRLEGRYVSKTERQITEQGLENCSAKLVSENSVIISCRAPIGHVAINEVPMSFNQGCKGLIPNEKITTEFLYYFLVSSKKLLNELGTGTTFKEISAKTLSNVSIHIPPLAEQQRIVAKLDAAFAKIDKAMEITQKSLASAENIFTSYQRNLFDKIASNAEFKKMGEYYDVRDGTHDSPKYVEEGYPLVTSKNLKSGKLDLTNVKFISETDYNQICQRSAVDVGDILMAMIGTIGNPIVIYEPPEFAIKNVALFKINPNFHSSEFLKFYLLNSTKKLLTDANGTTQKFVSLGYLRAMEVPVLPLAKQKEFAEDLYNVGQAVDNRKNALSLKNKELINLKSAILAQELRSEAA